MACSNDQNLSPFMKELLRSFQGGEISLAEEDLILRTSSPPFRVRSNLRTLVEQGYLNQEGKVYSLTQLGHTRLVEKAAKERTLS